MDVRIAIVQRLIPHYRMPFFERLAREPGLQLTVAADLNPKTESLAGDRHAEAFEVVDAPRVRVGPFFRQDGMSAVARDPRFNVVVFEWNSRLYQLPGALKIARQSGKGVALWGHGFGTSVPMLGNLLRNRLIRWADACILYGPASQSALIHEGHEAERLFVAPNAIDQSPVEAAIAYWRSGTNLQSFQDRHNIFGAPVLLYVSRLEPEKRPELLLDALRRVLTRRPDTRLVFIGDGSARASLEAKVHRMRLSQAVYFLGAEYDEMRIAPWALSSVCLIQPEKLGLSIFHAFGFGLPVITSGSMRWHGPEAEALENEVNGMFYRHGDVNDMSAKILRLLDDPALRGRLSEGAKRTVSGPQGRNLPTMVSGFLAAIHVATYRANHRRRESKRATAARNAGRRE